VTIQWIVLSDLHLGADQSVLTADDGVSPSSTAVALADCIRTIVGGDRPTLVLAGDAIELALTQMPPAFTVFERFLELVHGDDPIVGDRIIYIPGNHDHHLWQVSRQQGYMRAIQETRPGDDLPTMWFTSGLDPDQDLPLSPLVALMRRDPRWHGVFVDAVYPNLALRMPGVERSVIVHHGHLLESIYSAMSRLGSLVFPTSPPTSVERIELENNAWIDFLWSELGRSGGVGTDLHHAYHLLADPASVRHLTDQVADRVADRWTRWRIPPSFRRWLVRQVMGDVVAGARALETQHSGGVLSADAERGLRSYLDGPLAEQLRDAGVGDFAFVFGHTHKPFQQLFESTPGSKPIPVYNTGGWVNETAKVQRTQGAQAVLVDDHLSVVAVEFYRQTPNDDAFRVRVREPLVDDTAHHAFHAVIDARVRPCEHPFIDFSRNVAAELASRRRALDDLYAGFR
jgi:UDP-2,3-diacylglucosamine pyrophosphatase LpxH